MLTEPNCPGYQEYAEAMTPFFEKWIHHLGRCPACREWVVSQRHTMRAFLELPAEVLERNLDEMCAENQQEES